MLSSFSFIKNPLWGSLHVIELHSWSPVLSSITDDWLNFWSNFIEQMLSFKYSVPFHVRLSIPGLTSFETILPDCDTIKVPYLAAWRLNYPCQRNNFEISGVDFPEEISFNGLFQEDHSTFEYYTKRLMQELDENWNIRNVSDGMWIPDYYGIEISLSQESNKEAEQEFEWGYGDTTEELYQKTEDLFEGISISKEFGEIERMEKHDNDEEPDEDIGLLKMNEHITLFPRV